MRPWRDAHGGGGCCGGDVRGGICLDHGVSAAPQQDRGADTVAETYRLLRRHLPGLDVQIVGSDNLAFLLPAAFHDARRRAGRWTALRHALRSTTAGAVLVDGVVAGDIEELGPAGVLEVVRQAGNGTSSTAATV